ncbi:MAG: hypothetical protein WAM75_04400 [Xanthobacteraceae bacterium]
MPVLFNRVGYVIGTLISSPLAGRAGRHDLLPVPTAITGAALRSCTRHGRICYLSR